MARQRRGGFRPELRGTLGTLLRTTLAQAGTLREVLERGAREGRSRLDDALSTRRRSDALANLGEIVLDLIRRGEIDLGELPEVRDIVAHLDEIDAGHGHTDEEVATPPVRRRFDNRTTRERDPDDGTVPSVARRAGPSYPAPTRVWRPPIDDDPVRPADEITSRERPVPDRDPARKGGISFDDNDDDLASYMHPDDVPPKGRPDGDS